MVLEFNKRPRLATTKTTFKTETEKTIKSLIITLGLMILVLASASFIVANNESQKGYSLDQMKLENEALKDINEKIHVEIVNSTSSSNFEQLASDQGKIQPEGETFVTSEDNMVN